MKSIKAPNSILGLFFVGVLSLVLAHSGLAQIPLLAPLGGAQQLPAFSEQPQISHTVANRIFFSEQKEVASKQMWVGDARFLVHIQARESLKTVQSPLFQLPESLANEFKRMFYAVALQVILQGEVMGPKEQSLKSVQRLNQSA